MKSISCYFLLLMPVFAQGQIQDSLSNIKQVDSLFQQLRPLIELQKIEEASAVLDLAEQKTMAAFGKGHAAYATCLAYRGKIAQKKEHFKEAVNWYQEAMILQEKIYGKQSLQYVISMSTLSTIYLMMGDYVKAEPLLMETLALREKLVGKSHPDYARTLGNLGSLNVYKGYYGQAELCYQEALAIYEEKIGNKHPEYGNILGNLATVYIETGNYAKAEPLLLEVKEIHAAAFGRQSPQYVKALCNLASLYATMGKPEKAEMLNLEAKDIFTQVLGTVNSDYAFVLDNLADLYMKRGDYAKAEPLILEAEAVEAKIYGKNHKNYALALQKLAQLYMAKEDYARAEPLLLEAYHIKTATLANDHPSVAGSTTLLALLYQARNQFEEAGARFLESDAINRRSIERAAGYSSDVEMLAYLQTFEEFTAQFYTFAQAHPTPINAAAVFNDALFYKGFLLNAADQVKHRAFVNPESTKQFGTLQLCQKQLTEQYALPFAARDSARVGELEMQANTLQKELTRTVVGFGDALQQVNWQEVQAALKPGEAAIEFLHYQLQNRKGLSADSTLYAAVILLPGHVAPNYIPLFEERELSQLLQGASGGNYRKINAVYSAGATGQNSLYQLIWQQLETPLKGVTKIYCSLSGLLYRLNIGAIPVSPMESFADHCQVVVLGSTRQLVVRDQALVYNRDALLVGGVKYAENDAAIAEANRQLSRSQGLPGIEKPALEIDSLTRGGSWGFLPGTLTEVLSLRRILQSVRLKVKLDTGYQATEESIKATVDSHGNTAPRVLHFATHGYFFPDIENARNRKEIAFKASGNPLLRSGLILAGAQEIWTTGKPPSGREDGVLTAQEISLMNLSGTELVVLSACETGLGDISGNEGVYGLQRAFKIAGAKYILMSLWKVNDQSTMEFMQEFYSQWLKKGLDIPEAFRLAQHNLKLKYPGDAYQWAGFVLVE